MGRGDGTADIEEWLHAPPPRSERDGLRCVIWLSVEIAKRESELEELKPLEALDYSIWSLAGGGNVRLDSHEVIALGECIELAARHPEIWQSGSDQIAAIARVYRAARSAPNDGIWISQDEISCMKAFIADAQITGRGAELSEMIQIKELISGLDKEDAEKTLLERKSAAEAALSMGRVKRDGTLYVSDEYELGRIRAIELAFGEL